MNYQPLKFWTRINIINQLFTSYFQELKHRIENGLQLLTSTLPLESDKLASGCYISCMPKHLQTAQGPTHPSILPSLGLRNLRGRKSLKV